MTEPRRAYDLSEWELSTIDTFTEKLRDGLDKAMREAVADAIELSISEGRFRLRAAILNAPTSDGYGGAAVKDPLTLYVDVGFQEPGDADVLIKFNLREALAGELASLTRHGAYKPGFEMLRDALRRLADDIETAMPENTTE